MKKAILTLLLLFVSCFSLLKAQRHIVFVHGATGGGWNWKAMDELMTKENFTVSRPTLTGLGERVHLAESTINLDMHITDVVNHILFEELHEVILIGHSYGGMVITGVADRLKGRIAKLVYIDAHVPENGKSAVEVRRDKARGISEAEKEGFFAPSWLDESQIPGNRKQSMATLTQKIKLKNPAGNGIEGIYILTAEKEPIGDAFGQYLKVAEEKGWKIKIMRCGHNPQNTHRQELKELLLEVLD